MAYKADEYDQVKQRLRMAQKWRTDEGYDAKWRRMIDLYRGKTYWDNNQYGITSDRISVNLAFSEELLMVTAINLVSFLTPEETKQYPALSV